MKRVALSFLILLSCFQTLLADDGTFTSKLLNGRGWRKLNIDMKTAYVAGLHEALAYANELCTDAQLGESYPRFSHSQETVTAVDRFYVDPANAALPVLYAVRIFRMRVDGRPETEIQNKLEQFRKLAQNAASNSPK